MISTFTGRMGSTTKIVFAVLFFAMGCSTPSHTTGDEAIQEIDLARSRQIAEDFVRSHPDFITDNGQDLTLIAEEPLRCQLCWGFDFRYIALVNGVRYERYMGVVVQEGKASMVIPVEEGMPPK
jgi:hypothetical protein